LRGWCCGGFGEGGVCWVFGIWGEDGCGICWEMMGGGCGDGDVYIWVVGLIGTFFDYGFDWEF